MGRNFLWDKSHCKRGHEFSLENTRYTKNGRTGVDNRVCRICERVRTKKYDDAHPRNHRNGVISQATLKHRETKEELVKYKGGKCYDCGGEFPYCCYHFDHRNPHEKSFGIAQKCHKLTDELKIEADKCDLVCANCHAIRTFGSVAISLRITEGLKAAAAA